MGKHSSCSTFDEWKSFSSSLALEMVFFRAFFHIISLFVGCFFFGDSFALHIQISNFNIFVLFAMFFRCVISFRGALFFLLSLDIRSSFSTFLIIRINYEFVVVVPLKMLTNGWCVARLYRMRCVRIAQLLVFTFGIVCFCSYKKLLSWAQAVRARNQRDTMPSNWKMFEKKREKCQAREKLSKELWKCKAKGKGIKTIEWARHSEQSVSQASWTSVCRFGQTKTLDYFFCVAPLFSYLTCQWYSQHVFIRLPSLPRYSVSSFGAANNSTLLSLSHSFAFRFLGKTFDRHTLLPPHDLRLRCVFYSQSPSAIFTLLFWLYYCIH